MATQNDRGFSLVGVLVASAILGIVVKGIASTINIAFKAERHVALVEDISSIRRHITNSLDCSKTLQEGNVVGTTTTSALNTSTGNDCDPNSSAYKLLALKDKNGNPLTAGLQSGSGSFQNTGKLGSWQILTQCDRNSHTLVIRAARAGNQNGFAEDPLTKRIYDFTNDNSLYLYGGTDGLKICQAELGGAISGSGCSGADKAITSVDFNSKTVTCKTAVPQLTGCYWKTDNHDHCVCPSGMVMAGHDMFLPGYYSDPKLYGVQCLCCVVSVAFQ